MKKKILFIAISTVFIMLFACVSVNAFYLKIDGHYLSSTDDVNDIFGDGVYSFDRSTKTLTINKSPANPKSIIVDDDDLTLYIPKNVTLGDIYFKGSATITGNGTLTASYIDPYDFLEIKNTRVIAKYIGYDERTLYGDLYINNSYVNAKLGKFNSIDAVSCEMVSPSDYGIKYTSGTIGNEHKTYCAIINQHRVISAVNTIFAPWGKYGLIIVGTTVTDQNKNDILGDGKFSYNTNTKTLTVTDGYNSKYNGSIIDSKVDGLTINVVSERAELDSYTSSQIRLRGNTEITGGGAIFLKQSTLPGIEVLDGADLLLTDIKISAVDTVRFYAITGSGGALEISDSNLYLRGNTAAVSGFNNISMYECALTYPGTYVNDSNFCDANGIAKYIVIKKSEKYDLYVMGDQVTSTSCDSIRGGKNSYDPDNNILYIKDDMTLSPTYTFVESGIEGLKIQIEGNRTLTSNNKDYPAVILKADTTITGDKLTLKNTAGGEALRVTNGSTVNLDNISLNASGGFGIISYPFGATLNFNEADASISASGLSNSGAIVGFTGGISFNGCDIISPPGASVNESNGAVYSSGKAVENLVIGAGYELYIDEIQVTRENMADITGNGAFEYNPSEKTLYIHGSYTAQSADCLISNMDVDGLIIKTTEESTLEAPTSCIYANSDTTITGGKLTLKADEDVISADDCYLTIDTADLYIEGDYGIRGYNGGICIEKSDIEIKADSVAIGSITGYPATITLQNEAIASPKGAKLSEDKTKFTDNKGGIIKEMKLESTDYYTIDSAFVDSLEEPARLKVSLSSLPFAPDAIIVVAYFDRNDKCTGVKTSEITKDTKELLFDYNEGYEKIYIWKSKNSIKPLALPCTVY